MAASGGLATLAAWESYAVNLRSTSEGGGNEVTRYAGFPFFAVVRAHGGSIAVDSKPGRGSTFEIRLPLAPDSGGQP